MSRISHCDFQKISAKNQDRFMNALFKTLFRSSLPIVVGLWLGAFACRPAAADQVIALNGTAGGKVFEGVGAVSGGGATSVLLKDYPEPQRGQILDFLFKPRFGAAMSALFVEVPGDGNSTQGSELSHMHTRNDENYSRGYEWWLMSEAKRRNPDITLDGCAWGCPGWVGDGNFWSQDMCDYYAKWILGLKKVYGLDLDAIGCRNEKGVNEDYVKKFRSTLDAAGLEKVRIHGFDNWDKTKFDWTKDLNTDPELNKAVAILSNHTMATAPTPPDVRKLADTLNKPIWNSEEHVYKHGFDCEISLIQAFNQNYIVSGVTKVVCWYLVSSVYPIEPYPDVTVIVANSPWSGHYTVNPALWAYAHYGQFVKVGWKYQDAGCGKLSGGGTFVTMTSGADYSTIIETKGATASQKISFQIAGGLSTGKVCVWRSNEREQFVRLDDLTPVVGAMEGTSVRTTSGSFDLTVEPNSIYTVSTTSGQQKGSVEGIPAEKGFPFPYYETFDHYTNPKLWGYLPYYTADICGGFEIADRPDGPGKCLRQVIDKAANSWAPEWSPYTIIGDEKWSDYEVSADVYFDNGGWAGVMGRVNNTGSGYGCNPKGYYLRLDADGKCSLYTAASQGRNSPAAGRQLATNQVENLETNRWHNLKLQFTGRTLTALVDNKPVMTADDGTYAAGMAGLVTGGEGKSRNSALFANLIINSVNGPKPAPTVFTQDAYPMYLK
jgi:galactosylceramidase